MGDEVLGDEDVTARLAGLHPGWSGNHEAIERTVEFASFPTAVQFVDDLAPRCEALDHHPDLALRWRVVQIRLATHSAGGVTAKDVELAGIVDEVAASLPLA